MDKQDVYTKIAYLSGKWKFLLCKRTPWTHKKNKYLNSNQIYMMFQ